MPRFSAEWPPRVLQALGRFLPESIVEVLLNRVSAGREFRPDEWDNPRARRKIIDEICRRTGPFLKDPEPELIELKRALAGVSKYAAPTTASNNRVIPIESKDDILIARTECLQATRDMGLSWSLRTRTATIASELARNIVQHADRGRIALSVEGDFLVINARDKGPGIDDVDHFLDDAHLGKRNTGLCRIRKLAADLMVKSHPGAGTHVTVKILIG